MESRLEILKRYYQEEPNDPFNGYALALELAKQSRQEGLVIMKELLPKFPDYVPLYYQTAILLLELGLNSECKEIVVNGIATAKQQNEWKALRELQQLLQEVEGEV